MSSDNSVPDLTPLLPEKPVSEYKPIMFCSHSFPCGICDSKKWCYFNPHYNNWICKFTPSDEPRIDKTGNVGGRIAGWIHRVTEENNPLNPNSASAARPRPKPPEIAPPHVLHRAYTHYLQKFGLIRDHHHYLHKQRFFTPEQIKTRLFASSRHALSSELALDFQKMFGTKMALRIPGFVPTADEERYDDDIVEEKGFADLQDQEYPNYIVKCPNDCIAIPVRDMEGQIIAIKFRVDDERVNQESIWSRSHLPSSWRDGKRDMDFKYFSLSSSDWEDGVSPGAHTHFPLFDDGTSFYNPKTNQYREVETVRITEGEFKAEICSLYTKTYTVSIPGVTNWKTVLPFLEKAKVKTVRLAFDMDCWEKMAVAESMNGLNKACLERGIAVEVEQWMDFIKGLDDYYYIVSGQVKRTNGKDYFGPGHGGWYRPEGADHIKDAIRVSYVCHTGADAQHTIHEIRQSACRLDSSVRIRTALPLLDKEVKNVVLGFLPEILAGWKQLPEKSVHFVAHSMGTYLAIHGMTPNQAGGIVKFISQSNGEGDCSHKGRLARDSADTLKRNGIQFSRTGMKQILYLGDKAAKSFKKMSEILDNEVSEATKQLRKDTDEMLGHYDESKHAWSQKYRIPKLLHESMGDTSGFPGLISEDGLRRMKNRRLLSLMFQELKNLGHMRRVWNFASCRTKAKILLHNRCDAKEFAGLLKCNTVTCYTCRSSQSWLGSQFVSAEHNMVRYNSWPARVLVAYFPLEPLPGDLIPDHRLVLNTLKYNYQQMSSKRRGFEMVDSKPRTVVMRNQLFIVMKLDPDQTETEMKDKLERMGYQNVEWMAKKKAGKLYYHALIDIAVCIEELIDNAMLEDLAGDDLDLQEEAKKRAEILIRTVDMCLSRRFVYGGFDSKVTLSSGLASEQTKYMREKYRHELARKKREDEEWKREHSEEEEAGASWMDDDVEEEGWSLKQYQTENTFLQDTGEVVFADGCHCRGTAYVDMITGAEVYRVRGAEPKMDKLITQACYHSGIEAQMARATCGGSTGEAGEAGLEVGENGKIRETVLSGQTVAVGGGLSRITEFAPTPNRPESNIDVSADTTNYKDSGWTPPFDWKARKQKIRELRKAIWRKNSPGRDDGGSNFEVVSQFLLETQKPPT